MVNDLQQLGTGATTESMLAARVLAEVCSVYPDRNEALINAGTIALSKETGPIPGFGRVCDQPRWKVVRMTQEHGILGLDRHAEATDSDGGSVDKLFRVGQKVFLYCQHACITSAAFHVYYAVDDNDVVQDVWIPWRGW